MSELKNYLNLTMKGFPACMYKSLYKEIRFNASQCLWNVSCANAQTSLGKILNYKNYLRGLYNKLQWQLSDAISPVNTQRSFRISFLSVSGQNKFLLP